MYNYYCGNCGVSASATAKFCRRCGAKLASQSGGLPVIESTAESVLPGDGAVAVVSKSAALEAPPNTDQATMIAPRLSEASNGRAGEMAGEAARKPGSTSRATRITRAFGQMGAWLRARMSKSGSKPPAAANNQGAARALARASGLTLHHPLNSALRVAGIALALLLAASAFLAFRDQNSTTLRASRFGLNLTAPDDKSRQYVLLGKQDHDQAHYEAAIDDFKQAIMLLPSNTEAHFLLAKSYKAAGRIEDALQSYTQVLKIDDKNLEARYQLAEIYRDRGDWRAALTEYQRIIALDQSSEQALAALGEIESYNAQHAANFAPLHTPRQTDAQPQPALPWLPSSDSGSHLHPLLPDLTLTALSRPPSLGINNSADDSDSASALAKDHKNKAERFFNVHEYAATIKEAQAALDLTPDDKDLNFLIASSYYQTGQLADAREYAKKCVVGTYASSCQQLVVKTERELKDDAKKADAAKKKESQRGVGKPFKSLINTFK